MANDKHDLAHRVDELLGEFLSRDKKKRGRSPKGAGVSDYHRRAVELLTECALEGLLPPENLINLIATFLDVPESEPLSEPQKLALDRELRFRGLVPEGSWYTLLSAERVAEHAGVSRQTVHAWRKVPHYRRAFLQRFDARIAERIVPKLEERDATRRRDRSIQVRKARQKREEDAFRASSDRVKKK